MGKFVDRTGQRYGRLTVVRRANSVITPAGSQSTCWLCRCDCGAEKVVRNGDLTTGKTSSCGCLHAEVAGNLRRTHGMSRGPEHKSWLALKSRCLNPRNPDFPYYGGRGITVCAAWMDFKAFLADMGPRPGLDFSIDRIDPNGNYEPGNCRWATRTQQMRNTRRAVWVVYEGKRMSLHSAAALCGISPKALRQRYRKGWREPDLFLPIGSKRQQLSTAA